MRLLVCFISLRCKMARTQHLPLYVSTYVFVREIYRIRIKLPKILKFDLGQEAFQSSIKIIKCVVLANQARDKEPHINRLLLEIEVQWLMLRLLYDLKGISEGEFKVLSGRLADISKQAQVWAKWQKSNPKAQSKPENIESIADPKKTK